jgi:transposase
MTLTPARFEATSGLREFVGRSHTWLSDVQARTETVASTVNGSRAVVEVLVHMSRDGEQLDWPVAVVTESPDDRTVVFRSYYSQQAVDTRHHHIRPPMRDTVLDRLQVSEPTFYRWRNQFGGLKADDAKRLKDLERENSTLKRLLAEAELEKAALKEIAKGEF